MANDLWLTDCSTDTRFVDDLRNEADCDIDSTILVANFNGECIIIFKRAFSQKYEIFVQLTNATKTVLMTLQIPR